MLFARGDGMKTDYSHLSGDIFCRIIDNYGDIGVCWRLARQLHAEFSVGITLWVDDLATFARLSPALNPQRPVQDLDGITVRHWQGDIDSPAPGDLVIEGFACTLPASFLQAMAARHSAPLWINLDYLSAERWVEECHGLPSFDAATGLTKYFWFPGITPRTGGLLREAQLLADRDYFQCDSMAEADFWARIGVPEATGFQRRLSLFAYENPAIAGLLSALADDLPPSLLIVPAGRALADVAQWAGVELPQEGARLHCGALTIAVTPLLAHADYDRLLWGCTLNMVRGEDSFVRAQWAARPLLWHIYPQDENAHLIKLNAFIAGIEAVTCMPALWAEAMRAWNQADATPAIWSALVADLALLAPPARAWSEHLALQNDLASGLVRFLYSRLE
jgi:uncharacterized repeat protein (TIGR03837 family)